MSDSEAVVCPLCGAAGATLRTRVSVADLVQLYRSSLRIRIGSTFGPEADLRLLHCGGCGLEFFLPMRAGDRAFYEQLQRLDWYFSKHKQEFDFAVTFVRPGSHVLEIGCGDGHFADGLTGCVYTGLEYTEAAVIAARARGVNVLLEGFESYAVSHPEAADVVCAFQVLEHVPDPGVFVRSALACLRPGGLLIVSVPSADSFMGQGINNALNLPPHHVTWWSDGALGGLAHRFAMDVISLHHDVLADEHVDEYLSTLLVRSFDRPGRSAGTVDASGRVRLLRRLARLVVPILKRGLRPAAMRPRGHSVTVVYRKRPAGEGTR